jgi:hypothetical protein
MSLENAERGARFYPAGAHEVEPVGDALISNEDAGSGETASRTEAIAGSTPARLFGLIINRIPRVRGKNPASSAPSPWRSD